MKPRYLSLSLALAACLSSCIIVISDEGLSTGHWRDRSIEGSGHIVEEQRSTETFHAIELDMGADVEVRVGQEASVIVRGDDNLVEHVRTHVNQGVLHIDTRESHWLDGDISIEITTPRLASFALDGAGNVQIAGLEEEEFEACIDGAGTLRASGSSRRVLADIDGAGDILLQDLEAREAEASIDGAGEIHIRAAVSLEYDIDGAGSVVYYGSPAIRGDIDGAGSVHSR